MKQSARRGAILVVAAALSAGLVMPVARAFQSNSPIPAEYRIQIGDELEIKFFNTPDLNEQVIVRPDGRISLQLVPEVVVDGMTPAELTRRLTEQYAAQLQQPQVTVIVRTFGAQRVYVDGEVARAGVVPIVGLTTALQAIAQAGGFKESARLTEVVMIRRGLDKTPQVTRLNLKKARDGSDIRQDVLLQPFDIIYVPRSRVANVNLWVDEYLRKNIPIPFGLQYGIF
jgi:protein involved in polysaccharide export with SLBB domain